jgi:hypothetical protein
MATRLIRINTFPAANPLVPSSPVQPFHHNAAGAWKGRSPMRGSVYVMRSLVYLMLFTGAIWFTVVLVFSIERY